MTLTKDDVMNQVAAMIEADREIRDVLIKHRISISNSIVLLELMLFSINEMH